MQTESLVVTTLRAYREQLEARELDAMRLMANSWLQIERKLDADILALALEAQRRVNAGEVVTQQMIWKAEQYQIIKAKLLDETRRWNQSALIPQIETAQRNNAWMGIDAARDAIVASYGGPLTAPMFPVLNRGAVEAMVGFLGNGSPLNTLLKNDYPDALDGLVNALLQGIGRGLGPAAIAHEMANGMGMGLDRAMLIARTEIVRSYRTANIQAYRESGVVGGFMRLVKKATACMACLMQDGERFAVEDDLTDHPAGKCIPIPVVKGTAGPHWQTGPEWFKGLPPEQQAAKMGAEKYAVWKAGKFELADLAKLHHSSVWGDAPRVATLGELGA